MRRVGLETHLKNRGYDKTLTNLDDAEDFAASDNVKKEKVRATRERVFAAVDKEKEEAIKQKEQAEAATMEVRKQVELVKAEKNRADQQATAAQKQTEIAKTEKSHAKKTARSAEIITEAYPNSTHFDATRWKSPPKITGRNTISLREKAAEILGIIEPNGKSDFRVELTSLRAIAEKEAIQLLWETASERNNVGFQIERSENGWDFEKIAFVAGAGTSAEMIWKQIYKLCKCQ